MTTTKKIPAKRGNKAGNTVAILSADSTAAATHSIAVPARSIAPTGHFCTETARVQQQTDAEWIAEYDGAAEFRDSHVIDKGTQNAGTPTGPNEHGLNFQAMFHGSGIIRTKPKGPVPLNTLKSAVHFPTVSGILLCSEFNTTGNTSGYGCGLGAMVRKAIGVTGFTFRTPSPPDVHLNAEGGFAVQPGTNQMAIANSTTTPTSGTPTSPDHTSLSFIKVEHFGKRNQRLTNWFAVPAEPYGTGNITGFKIAAELMAWVQSRPSNYETGMIVREIMAAAFAVLAEPCTPGKSDRRGCAVTFLDGMAAFLMFAAQRSDHQAYLAGEAQRSETWARESAQMDAERNRQTGLRLAAARRAKREAKAMEAGVA